MLQRAANGSIFFSREDLIVVSREGIVRFLGHIATPSSCQEAQEIVDALLAGKPMPVPASNSFFFGRNITIGDSHTGKLTISNAGRVPLEITGMWPNFSTLSATFPLTIPAGSQRPFEITFMPDVTGTISGPIRFFTNDELDPDSASTIAISYRNTTAGPFTGIIDILSDDPDRPTLTLSNLGTVQVLPANPKADFDDNGKVDFSDFLSFTVAFGSTDPTYDISGNGTVDFADFLTLAQSFGKSVN